MMGNRQRVSLCMIVRDEEKNLEACLTPVADLFDEIIIVDTGSQDGTIEIARRFTPHVHHFPWCDDFSAARNESLRHGTGDWIFWLDADDRVGPSQVADLRSLFEQLDEQPRVFMLNTTLPTSPRDADPQLISHARLFRRDGGWRWRGRVHEQIAIECPTGNCPSVLTDIAIEHVGYQDGALAQRKNRRKLRLLRMDYAVDPNDPSTLFHLGMAMFRSRNYGEAAQHFVRILELELGAAACVRWVYDALISMAQLTGKPAEAAWFVKRGLAQFPDDEYLLMAQANILLASRDYAGAAAVLERVMRSAPSRRLLFESAGNLRTKLAPRMLGAAYRMQRAFGQAERILKAVTSAFPDDCESWFNLGLVYLDQARGPELDAIVEQLSQVPGGTTGSRLLSVMWHLRRGDLELAGRIIDDLITAEPKQTSLRMLRFEWLSRSRAPVEAQMRALNDVLRIDPSNLEARYWMQKAGAARQGATQTAAAMQTGSLVITTGAAAA